MNDTVAGFKCKMSRGVLSHSLSCASCSTAGSGQSTEGANIARSTSGQAQKSKICSETTVICRKSSGSSAISIGYCVIISVHTAE